MSIILSSADLKKVAGAVRLLTSPLDHGSVDGWRSAVNRHLREMLDADSVGFLLPVTDGLMLYSEEHDPASLARYPDYPPPPTVGGVPAFERINQLGVSTLERIYGRAYDRYLNSTYYNEYAGANGAHDTLAAGASLGGNDAYGMASLMLWHGRPDGRRFGEREVALMRLLFPAFRAGVESHVRWGEQREDLVHALDGLGQAALICSIAGRVLHVTPALAAVLEAEPEAAHLRAELRATVREACGSASGTGALVRPAGDLVREVRTGTARYRLRGCMYGGPSADGSLFAIVGLERLTPALPSAERIRERFGLTRRQADVALLLARRKTNAEIADELCISPHTARHHTEAVMSRLGVRNRRDVASTIGGAGDVR